MNRSPAKTAGIKIPLVCRVRCPLRVGFEAPCERLYQRRGEMHDAGPTGKARPRARRRLGLRLVRGPAAQVLDHLLGELMAFRLQGLALRSLPLEGPPEPFQEIPHEGIVHPAV